MSNKHHTTFNQLDERFQWHEGLDREHIFDEEREMIKELRAKVPELEKESDKFAVVFLFARRHDIKETVELLRTFYKKKAALNMHEHIPTFKYNPVLQSSSDLGGVPQVQFRGFRDVHNRMLRCFWLGQEDPSKRTLEYTYVFWYFQIYYLIDTEPVDAWRNGVALLVDLKGFGWSNLDMGSRGRETTRAMQGVFPIRIRAIYAFNGGAIVSALVAACRLLLPKKFMSRVHLLDVSELKNIVPSKYLFEQHGGECTLTLEDFQKELLENEAELFCKGLRSDDVPVLDGADRGSKSPKKQSK